MFNTNASQQRKNLSGDEKHQQVMEMLDEIKRYSAGIYQNVDNEIKEIQDTLRRLESQIKENDRQIDRIEQFHKDISRIEGAIKNLERKI